MPLFLVVLFGVGACGILVAGRHLVAPALHRPTRPPVETGHVGSRTVLRGTTRDAFLAWLFLLGCWTTRAIGSMLLLAALGVGFSPTLALVVLCLAAAASLIPITSGGAIANVGATAAVLLALGVHRQRGDQLRSRLRSPPLHHRGAGRGHGARHLGCALATAPRARPGENLSGLLGLPEEQVQQERKLRERPRCSSARCVGSRSGLGTPPEAGRVCRAQAV